MELRPISLTDSGRTQHVSAFFVATRPKSCFVLVTSLPSCHCKVKAFSLNKGKLNNQKVFSAVTVAIVFVCDNLLPKIDLELSVVCVLNVSPVFARCVRIVDLDLFLVTANLLQHTTL